MKYKKGLIVICLIVFLFSIASVCASDVNETVGQCNVLTVENNNPIENEINNDSIESYHNNNEIMNQNNILMGESEDIIGVEEESAALGDTERNSFSMLSLQINNAGSSFTLIKDYAYYAEIDSKYYSNGIKITQSFTLNGDGHTIDGSGSAKAFIDCNSLTLKNINFKNFGSVTISGKGTISGCTFTNCGSITWNGVISNCNFVNCGKAYSYLISGARLSGCSFSSCSASLGALISSSTNVISCSFNKCTAGEGIIRFKSSGVVTSCSFNSCSNYCIYSEGTSAPSISDCTFNNAVNDWCNFIYSNTKLSSGLSVSIPNTCTIEDTSVSSYINAGASGVVMFYLDNVYQYNVSVKSFDFKDIGTLDIGSHTLKFVYNGDRLFNSATISKTVNVVKANSPITIKGIKNIEGIIFIDISMGNKHTGNITLNIDNKTFNALVSNGIASFECKNLTPGKYNCTFKYQGDKYHYSSTLKSEISIPIKQCGLKIIIENNYITKKPKITIKSYNLNAEITANINNQQYTRTLVNGTTVIQLETLPIGDYPLKVYCSGNSEYLSGTFDSKLSITKIPVNAVINVKNNTYPEKTTVTFKFDIAGTAKISLDGVKTVEVQANKEYSISANLDAGMYLLPIHFYPKDTTYYEEHFYTLKVVHVFRKPISMQLSTPTTYYGEDSVYLNVKSTESGTIRFTIDNKIIKSATVKANTATKIGLGVMSGGTHKINVFMDLGNDNYEKFNKTYNLNIKKHSTKIEATVENILYSQTTNIYVKGNVSGKVIVSIDNKYNKSVSINANVNKLVTFDNIPLGKHNVSILLKPTNEASYIESSFETQFTVSMRVDISDINENDNAIVNVYKYDTPGTITITLDNNVTKIVSNSIDHSVNFGKLPMGYHVVNVTMDLGDDGKFYTTHTFKVMIPSIIEGTVENIVYSQSTNVTVKANVNGTVTVYIDDQYRRTVTVVANETKIASFNTWISAGSHIVKFELNPTDGLYNKSYYQTNYNVSKKPATIECSVGNILYSERVPIKIKGETGGKASVILDNNSMYTWSNIDVYTDGAILHNLYTINPPDVGTHNISIIFEPQSKNYMGTTYNTTFVVSKKPATIQLEVTKDNYYYGENVVVKVKSSERELIDIIVANYTNSIRPYVYNSWDNCNLYYVFPVGSYIINADFRNNENYEVSVKTTSFTVSKKNVILTAPNSVNTKYSFADSEDNLIVKLTDDINSNLYGKVITINVDGKQFTQPITYSYNGAKFRLSDFHLTPGTYNANISYEGDEYYKNSSTTIKIIVNKDTTYISANPITTTFNINKDLVVTLKDGHSNPLAGVQISINFNGVKYLTTDYNGNVKLSIYGLTPAKTYTATITFAGNTNYTKSTTTVKVSVTKATPKLTAKAKTFKKSVKTKKYSITLKDNQNKAMKNTKVTIKINKKTYTAKTNSKGVATFKIKKLTKKGTFKSTVTYKGDKYYNKVTKSVKIKVK